MRCIHKKDRPYVCLPCNAFFHTKNELTQHTASHPSPPASDKSGDDSESSQSAESAAGSQSAETKPPVVELPNGTKIQVQQPVCVAVMSLERMRMLLAILLKRISTPSRLRRLGYGQKLIDTVLVKSIESSGRPAAAVDDSSADPKEMLKRNIEILLDWTIPKEYMDHFRQEKKSVEEILEELTS